MSKAYIVIPHYNRYDLLNARLWELYKYCREDIAEVLVIDNGSTDENTQGGLGWWAEFRVTHDFNISAIRLEENVGFLLASNRGIFHFSEKLADDDIIILLSNDVEVRNNFVRQMTDIISQNPKSLVGGILYAHDTGWNKFGDRVFPYLEGWLLGMTKAGWTLAEWGFDERFVPCDYEDVDLSTFMVTQGYELVPLNNPGVRHLGGQTLGYSKERETQTKINRKKFEEKWI